MNNKKSEMPVAAKELNQSTKDILKWYKFRFECFIEGDEVDEVFLEDLQKAARKTKLPISKAYLLLMMQEDGYLDFSESGFPFIGGMLKRNLGEVNWEVVDQQLLKKVPQLQQKKAAQT